jgi:outer membrane protein insertion porin family
MAHSLFASCRAGRLGPTTPGGHAVRTLILLALLAGLPGLTRAQTAPPPWGRTVLQIQLQCDCNLKLASFAGAVTQQIGQPLDREKISESLKRLYATGRFSELRADAAARDNGVDITFIARAQFFVGVVTAQGNTGPLEPRALVTASRLRLGQPLEVDDLSAAEKRLSDLMASNGYYQSHISHHIAPNPETLEANVVFSVQAGPPARLSSVEFPKESQFPADRLMKVAGWHPHLILTGTRLERGLYRLHQFYLGQGHLQADVAVEERDYDPKSHTEKLVVRIEAGPLLRVRVQGAGISRSQLQSLLPLYRDGVTDDQALEQCERLLEGHFQQEGYFSAAVTARRSILQGPPPHTEIVFHVELGSRGEFAGYGVKGNVALTASQITSTINPPSEGLFPSSPTYSQSQVDDKVAALKALYQSRGYLQVSVTPEINDNFGGVKGRRYVTLVIREGALTLVHTLTLDGIDAATESKLWPSLLSKPTEPYSPDRARADRDHIRDYLADRGYAHAAVNWHAAPSNIAQQVDLTFQIDTGVQQRIQSIVVLGNSHVRPGLVNRELRFKPGEPLSQDAVLDSQRSLYDLGLFNQVQITPQEQSAASQDQTILVGLEESHRWNLGYGGGLEVQRLGSNTPQGTYDVSPRGSLSLTRLDVGGRGQTFSLNGRLSYIDTGADVGYLIPRLLNRDDLDLRIKLLTDLSREVLTFTENLQQASLSVEKHLHGASLLIAEYRFERVQALDISNKVSPEEAELYSQPAIVGILGGTFIRDTRDDALDATRGSYSLINAGIAWKGLGSEGDFMRFNGKNSTYYNISPHLVFARLTQFGIVSPYGGLYSVTLPATATEPAEVIGTHEIPLPERFFMGGSQSMRGFSINQAGPRDPLTGYPIGGNALFLNSLEFRTFFAQRRLGIVAFEDAGNVYSTIRRMRLLKFTQSSPQDFDYTSHAVGLGLRFKTPVGPLSFDFGYNLNPPRYNVVSNINNITTTQVQRLSNFQYFVNFGQSF